MDEIEKKINFTKRPKTKNSDKKWWSNLEKKGQSKILD